MNRRDLLKGSVVAGFMAAIPFSLAAKRSAMRSHGRTSTQARAWRALYFFLWSCMMVAAFPLASEAQYKVQAQVNRSTHTSHRPWFICPHCPIQSLREKLETENGPTAWRKWTTARARSSSPSNPIGDGQYSDLANQSRNALAGSVRIARQVGKKQATNVAVIITTNADPNAQGSRGLTL
jgi:hypothetical protein